ncbi:MAG: cation transporter [Eubacterium sp.]|nr:cation transporter [Eubacterium sp.]
MTDFLIKLYIKNKDVDDLKAREKYSALSGITGIVCNVALCIFKFIIGTLTRSVSVTADAVNNLSDAGSNIVTILGGKLAGKAVDEEHPFGHGRMEYVSALIVSFFIFIMGFELGKSSITKIIYPEEIKFNAVSVIVLIVAIAVKLWMAYFNNKLFKATGNIGLKAVMQDSLNDCIATSATIAALLISSLTPFKRADGIMGVIVAAVVIIAGVKLVKEVVSNILGKAPSPELVSKIKEIMLNEKYIMDIHDLIVHDYGPGRIIASAHAEVPSNVDIIKLHEVIDIAERKINKELNIMICIHMDPVVVDDEKLKDYKQIMADIIHDYDADFTFHDFRVIEGTQITNFVFDLVIPHKYKKGNNLILKELQSAVRELYPNITLVITIEHAFI